MKTLPAQEKRCSTDVPTLPLHRCGDGISAQSPPNLEAVRLRYSPLLIAACAGLGACADPLVESDDVTVTSTISEVATSSTSSSTSSSSTTAVATTLPQITTTSVAVITDATMRDDLPVDVTVEFGRSVLGRSLEVIRRGDPNGARVLAIGCIHGDEDAGVDIIRALRTLDVPEGVELWLVPTMNPDGTALDQRHNANGVDLNRNFGVNWAPLGEPGNWQYGGPDAASEPETAAMSRLGELVQPDLVLWYHQDLYRINPSSGVGGQIRARYAELTGLPLLEVTGGTYTGTASQWSRTVTTETGTGFTVELGASLSPAESATHAAAVIAVAAEFLSSTN